MGYGTRELDVEMTVEDVTNLHYEVGKKIHVRTKIDKSLFDVNGVVVGDYPFFFIVDTGLYRMAINKIDLLYRYGGVAVKEVS